MNPLSAAIRLSISRRFTLLFAAATLVAVVAFAFSVATGTSGDTGSDIVATVTSSSEQVARGEYLALAGNCASCHTVGNQGFMAGGLAFATPFGKIFSTNITPDAETGIGNWTAQQFVQSMRHGIRPDGEHLYPVFPYTSFTRMSNEDIVAVYAYLKSIPAIRNQAMANELSFPFNVRSLLAAWKAMFFKAGVFEADETESAQWNRGAYLVEAMAHCGACHSPRNALGAEKAELAMTGGEYIDKVPSGELRPWSAPNLTSVADGLGMWPQEEIVAYLATGRNSFVDSFGPMNEVIMNSTQHLNRQDVAAMAAYLKSLPPNRLREKSIASEQVLGMGRTQYNLHCGTCHLPTGLGDAESAPRLAGGSLVVQADNPASLINVILDGPQTPQPPLPDKWLKSMESFRYLMDDQEIAALASYVRSSWGNSGGEVTAEQVARQR